MTMPRTTGSTTTGSTTTGDSIVTRNQADRPNARIR